MFYLSLIRREESLHCAKLAVTIAHERLGVTNKASALSIYISIYPPIYLLC